MITKIWLKGKTKGSEALSYPNCLPKFFIPSPSSGFETVQLIDIMDKVHGTYMINTISRIEFRP